MTKQRVNRKTILNVYCDMDGVIANFLAEPNALDRYKNERGFFANLEPMNADGFEQLIAFEQMKRINLYILTTTPNKQAYNDKMQWLRHHYPQIKKSHIIIGKCGSNKADYVKNPDGSNVLLDDYGKNCNDFIERGFAAIKIYKPLIEHLNEFLLIDGLDY